ncbi:MAG: TonB-dependent receptor domain-containing protein [Oceanicaulis sp.]
MSVVAYDPAQLLADGVYQLRPLDLGAIPNKQWRVEEDVVTGYVQANLDTDIGLPMRGNLGLQVVHTDQSSTGPVAFNGADIGAIITDGDTYTEVLPSLNLVFELNEDTFVRLGAARTLARARMDDLRASAGLGVSQRCGLIGPGGSFQFTPQNAQETCLSGGSGNPRLRPYSAESFDVSIERYFADGLGYVSLAAFHKELDNWVFGSVTRRVDGSEILDTAFGPGTAAANPDAAIIAFSNAENTEGGYIRGLEFSLSLPGEAFLPEQFAGLGMFATYSITDSEVQPPMATDPITIPGLSEDLGNITVYYERGGFEARVSNRWRSDFLAELPDFTGQPDFRRAFDESIVDAQVGYEFLNGPLTGLAMQLQASNLFDERFGTYIDNRNGVDLDDPERFARNWEEYGATYTLRLRYQR